MVCKCSTCGAFLENSSDFAICPNSLKHTNPCLSGLFPRMKMAEQKEAFRGRFALAVGGVVEVKRCQRERQNVYRSIDRDYLTTDCRFVSSRTVPKLGEHEGVIRIGKRHYAVDVRKGMPLKGKKVAV